MRKRSFSKRRGYPGKRGRRTNPRMKVRKSARIPGNAMKVGFRL